MLKYFSMLYAKSSMSISYDHILVWLILFLSCVGFVMSVSASMFIGMKLSNDPLCFLKREILYYILSFALSLCVLYLPLSVWKRSSVFLLLMTIMLLFVASIFSIPINGASRWIMCGFFHMQPSELSKLTFFCYLSSYLEKVIGKPISFLDIVKPVSVIVVLLFLLLMQPDFGSVIILILTILSVLFISGILYWKFLFLLVVIVLFTFLLVIEQPYRVQRIVSFLDPWKDPFGSGYQLIQSLVAFGRGKFFGQGLGNSVQKIEYLPEAHSDFIFAILAEELGFFGVLLVLLMMILIFFRGMLISYKSFKLSQMFSGFLASSISLCFSYQVLINVGTVTGVLPTKGSTLPFISYGGSSFLIIFISVFLLLRIDFELRFVYSQAFVREVQSNEKNYKTFIDNWRR